MPVAGPGVRKWHMWIGPPSPLWEPRVLRAAWAPGGLPLRPSAPRSPSLPPGKAGAVVSAPGCQTCRIAILQPHLYRTDFTHYWRTLRRTGQHSAKVSGLEGSPKRTAPPPHAFEQAQLPCAQLPCVCGSQIAISSLSSPSSPAPRFFNSSDPTA
jgi:hypothetical protein